MPHVDVLLFVGVAVAWALYLIPKAVQRHEQASKDHAVDRFSHRMRVLARREPVSTREAELVTSSARAAETSVSSVTASAPLPRPAPEPARVEVRADQARRQREAAQRATRRRRRVLGLLLVALAAVAGVAWSGVIQWWYVAIPGGLLVAWLVACRVMVKGERARARRAPSRAGTAIEEPAAQQALDMDETTEIARVAAAEPGMWDPVPVTLPTYVDKPAATRTVHSIDLESEGVWTSGHTQADTALARRADADAAAARAARESGPQASGEHRAAGAAG